MDVSFYHTRNLLHLTIEVISFLRTRKESDRGEKDHTLSFIYLIFQVPSRQHDVEKRRRKEQLVKRLEQEKGVAISSPGPHVSHYRELYGGRSASDLTNRFEDMGIGSRTKQINFGHAPQPQATGSPPSQSRSHSRYRAFMSPHSGKISPRSTLTSAFSSKIRPVEPASGSPWQHSYAVGCSGGAEGRRNEVYPRGHILEGPFTVPDGGGQNSGYDHNRVVNWITDSQMLSAAPPPALPPPPSRSSPTSSLMVSSDELDTEYMLVNWDADLGPDFQSLNGRRDRTRNYVGGFVSGLRRLPRAVLRIRANKRELTWHG